MTALARWIAVLLVSTGCREIFDLADPQLAGPDAGARLDGSGGTGPQPGDAAGVGLITSQQQFPTPYILIEDFNPSTLSAYGVFGEGFDCCPTGSTWGNPDAPLATPFAQASFAMQTMTFVFPGRIRAVGISVADGFVGSGGPVIVTLKGIDGAPVALHARTLLPALTYGDQQDRALFIGVTSPIPFEVATITIDQPTLTYFDNLVFAP